MIFYFSGTGNSQYVAEQLAERLGDKLVSIAQCVDEGTYTFNVTRDERVGIVCPTYYFGLPGIVEQFLSRLELKGVQALEERKAIADASKVPLEDVLRGTAKEKAKSKASKLPKVTGYVYLVATYGMNSGQVGTFAANHLAARGVELDARFAIKMPENYTPVFDVNDQAKIAGVLAAADVALKDVIKHVKARDRGDFIKRKAPMAFSSPYHLMYGNACATNNFYAYDTCTGCGLCERDCPVHAIELQDGKPRWIKPYCTLCLRCLHHCPEFAIQYGKKTPKHGQYVNPNVK